ncbi:MAG: ATP-binding cassette domain-containing protein [Gammaproteobacteria bacterium]|nr:ATP-binding cassette domain-containing protein [Gammaproteobacteria bacterium]
MSTVVIEARCLNKSYGTEPVVRGIDFTVNSGCCFGLLGPNGAGKTTTIAMILGLSPITSGSLTVFGLSIYDHAMAIRARAGIVPQSDNLDPDLTLAENLRVYGSYFRIEKSLLEQRVEELLEFAELSDRANARPDALSGGMKRRLTVARALINDPELVVLDEPSSGLDPQMRHMIWARLRQLVRQGKTLLLTTHYMEEAERLCDELVVMDHGRILDQGSPRQLIQKHIEPEVLEVIGHNEQAIALLDGRSDCRVESAGDTLYIYTHDAAAIMSRLQSAPELTFSHRPANLEDVFLKLTGRELRE